MAETGGEEERAIWKTHPHSRVQRPCDLVVLLQTRARAQDLRKPELLDGTLHVAYFALGRGGSFNPLRGLSTNTADHVGVG